MKTLKHVGAILASVIVPVVTVTAAETRYSTPFDWDRTRYVYAFGDSYTFVQG